MSALYSSLQGADAPDDAKDAAEAKRLRRNWAFLALCFSLNHGCVTALIALASSSLGYSLGNTSSGILYCVYTLTAAFGSKALTVLAGAKRTLSIGLWVYCGYVASYLVAYYYEDNAGVQRLAIYTGAVLGGLAAGVLWPAQGTYYACTADRYARCAGMPRAAANSVLGADFAAFYLACEVAMKLLSSALPSLLPDALAKRTLYALFTSVACAAAAGVSLVDDVEAPDGSTFKERLARLDVGAAAASALRLLAGDAKCACMVPMNFAFGFGAAYLNGYFFSNVVAPGLGAENIGYVSSIVVGTAAACAVPLGRLGRAAGTQLPLVALGACCFGIFAAANLAASATKLQAWASVVPLVMLFGVGRSVWENNFKASFADYFPNDTTAAFANVQLQSGVASTVGFFLNSKSFGNVDPKVIGRIAVASAILAVIGQVAAAELHRREQRSKARLCATSPLDSETII
ncbi:major facilitator superfamily domain-containing protein [Pelagophyceae sp. CCMP2097]|nr:major facilitator superfamily domain-containing protein [Pelagophyceae sp. CCMP2097]